MPFLIYRDGTNKQQLYVLEDTAFRKISVGRDFTNDISFTWDSEVSSVHAGLERIGGHWALIDDGLSRNGTYVNSQRVGGRLRLRDGDVLRFGETVAVYRAPLLAGSGTAVSDSPKVALNLSDSQRRILIALCRPYKDVRGAFATPATNRQIAEELFLSVDAVKTHLRTLFRKFAIEDLPNNQKRVTLVERAFHSGLISERDL